MISDEKLQARLLDDDTVERTCRACGATKLLREFAQHGTNKKTGHALRRRVCHDCYRVGAKKRKALNLDPVILQQDTECSFEGCNNPSKALDLCATHFRQFNDGEELRPIRLQRKRLPKTDPWVDRAVFALDQAVGEMDDNGCFIWRGTFDGKNYGAVQLDGVPWLAHRLSLAAYIGDEHALGTEPVHHICHNTRCINPEHLVLTTQRENNIEMLEREYYKRRIRELEEENKQLKEKYEALLTC